MIANYQGFLIFHCITIIRFDSWSSLHWNWGDSNIKFKLQIVFLQEECSDIAAWTTKWSLFDLPDFMKVVELIVSSVWRCLCKSCSNTQTFGYIVVFEVPLIRRTIFYWIVLILDRYVPAVLMQLLACMSLCCKNLCQITVFMDAFINCCQESRQSWWINYENLSRF